MESERPGQYRGVPYLAQAIEPLLQMRRYTNAELDAAVIQASFSAFVKTEGPDRQPVQRDWQRRVRPTAAA